ncbi:MAG: hypothetical protein IKM34_03950 [Clostridia bacterium]|nr:hypothetical protein [Clostridia bacterium]
MKKLLSILLIGSLLCSIPCLQIFASATAKETYQLTETPKESPQIINADQNHVTCLENTPSLEQYESSSPIDTIFLQQQSIGKTSIHFNETSDTFIQKITSDNLSIDGYTANENSQSISLTDYFTQNQASRFDIVDIAYQNNLITETEKIEAYCNLYENKQFENTPCLHGVVVTLSQYRLSENASEGIKERIDKLFLPSSTVTNTSTARSASDDENLLSYSSPNFIIKYETGIAYSEVVKVANHMESVRTQYVTEMEYRAPLLDNSNNKYPITLHTGEDPTVSPDEPDKPAGVTKPKTFYGTRCSTEIEIFTFSSLTTEEKETLAHEYFHAIQCAYNWRLPDYQTWFSEGSANWAALITQGTSLSMDEHINMFLASDAPFHFEGLEIYGLVLYYLTMQDLCETTDVVRELWEEYAKAAYSEPNYSLLVQAINNTLSPYGESFNSVYLTMGCYNFSPSYWYSPLHPGGSSATNLWVPRIETINNTVSRPQNDIDLYPNETYPDETKYLFYYSHQYHKFIPDKMGQNSKIVIKINFEESTLSNGICYFYYVTVDGSHTFIKLPKSGPNKYIITTETYGGDIIWCGIVLANPSTWDADYSIQYHVERGTEQTLSLASNLRYYEKVENIGKGEYIDYHVTFATGGNKLIQTFGLKNTYLEIYDGTTNAKLAEDNNSGVGLNAFISHSFTANKPYRIRLMYTTQPVSGETKFVIIPSTAYSTYANIPAYTNSTSDISGTYTQYQSNLISCKFTTEQTLTVHLQSNVDSYLYIINPRSTNPITQANNNSPDTTKDAEGLYNDDYNGIYSSQITKTMLANKDYLIIACKYSPSSSASGSYTISFD